MDDPIVGDREPTAATTIPDRRSSGRPGPKKPHPFLLLRGKRPVDATEAQMDIDGGAGLSGPEDDSDHTELAAARGIGRAILVGAVMWAVIGVGLWLLFRR
jgi:hypothetical protein